MCFFRNLLRRSEKPIHSSQIDHSGASIHVRLKVFQVRTE